MLEAELKALLAVTLDEIPIKFGKPEADLELPYCWFDLETQEHERLLDGTIALTRSDFILECIAESVDDAIELWDALVTAYDSYGSAAMGDSTCLDLTFERFGGDYEPRNYADEGRNIVAGRISIIST